MSLYIKIDNNERVIANRPQWYDDTGRLLSDEELVAHGYFLVVREEPPYNEERQSPFQKDISEWDFDGSKFYVTYVIEDIPYDEFKFNKLKEINDNAQATVNQFMDTYPRFEIATWDIQKAEAEAYAGDIAALTPFCDVAAHFRGINRVDFITRVKEKSDLFVQVSAMIAGYRQKLEDQVLAIDPESPTAIDDVLAIIWESPLNGLV